MGAMRGPGGGAGGGWCVPHHHHHHHHHYSLNSPWRGRGPLRLELQRCVSGGWKQGASTAGLGEGGRNAPRQGVPRETFWPGSLAFPQISAPVRPPRPCFHPPRNTPGVRGAPLPKEEKRSAMGAMRGREAEAGQGLKSPGSVGRRFAARRQGSFLRSGPRFWRVFVRSLLSLPMPIWSSGDVPRPPDESPASVLSVRSGPGPCVLDPPGGGAIN